MPTTIAFYHGSYTLIFNGNHLWNESDVEGRVVGGRLHEPVDEEALVVDHCGPGW